jgi:hypothetical protein
MKYQCAPQPRRPLIPTAQTYANWREPRKVDGTLTIDHGTAIAAFAASSLMCTLESNAPKQLVSIINTFGDEVVEDEEHTDRPKRGKEGEEEGITVGPAIN